MTPWPGNNLATAYPPREWFNFFHSQLRITIERTFGIFIGRWSIFWGALRYDLEMREQLLWVAATLNAGVDTSASASTVRRNENESLTFIMQRIQMHEANVNELEAAADYVKLSFSLRRTVEAEALVSTPAFNVAATISMVARLLFSRLS
ncbi:hypothetical protein B484DRAFT_402072 [Ochromonadaceae sp. CCMP2298]|nr:hypothetical protein B484DRAFT_402072 [Ochromonadaceae sp. CCMP2298]